MSALPHRLREIGYAGLRLTAEEYLALGETDERYELIDGVVVAWPNPFASHNEIALEIAHQLKTFAAAAGGVRVFPETDVRIAAETVYRPDICAYRAERLQGRVQRLETPPDLVVEILSAGSKALDLITKRDDYERFGVGEYWAVDPESGHVRCWQREGGRLCERPGGEERLAAAAIPGFVLALGPVRALAGGGGA